MCNVIYKDQVANFPSHIKRRYRSAIASATHVQEFLVHQHPTARVHLQTMLRQSKLSAVLAFII